MNSGAVLIVEPSPTSQVDVTSVTTTRSDSGRRIVSSASIADPTQDSAGGNRVWASTEKASDIFANVLIPYVFGWLWPHGISLDWVTGRSGPTTYNGAIRMYFFFQVNSSPQEAILTMNNSTSAARTDGCLQIEVEDPNSLGSRSFWSRQYYVVPLEVPPHPPPSQSLIQAKRYYCEKGKETKATCEITNLKNSVFAGQIFAEMLAGICHEEFYRYSDQEVQLSLHTVTHLGVRNIYYPYFFPIVSRFIRANISPIRP